MSRPATDWSVALADDGSGTPLFRRISRAVVAEIRRGRLRPGEKLPGTRTLARTLQVNRNTVLAAYEELAGEGWTEPSRASATFVSRSLPEVKARDFSPRASRRDEVPGRVGFDLKAAPDLSPLDFTKTPGLMWSVGSPDLRLAPAAQLARAFRRALTTQPRAVLRYGHMEGHPRLRAALATMLATTRGLATSADDVVVTSGSQMAIDLVSRALLRPGDLVAVEQIGYRSAWATFQQNGARLVPIPVDAGGMDMDALAVVAARSPIRAVYITPHHQYPTTATLTAGRRIALLQMAKRMRFAVIEDDYDHEFHYDGRPVLPLASADQSGVVVYVGTLAKILAPGVRLGYVVAPRPLLESVAAHRFLIDRQGVHALEYAVAELLEQGDLQRHVRRAKRIYQARRDFLARELRTELAEALSFNTPAGGMAIWAKVSPDIDADEWAGRALAHKLIVYTAKRYAFDGCAKPYVRLNFAAFDERELGEAVRAFKKAL